MERIVDRAVSRGLLVPGGQAVQNPLAIGLHGEIDDRCGATPGRGAGSSLERVAGRGATERQFHVGVRIHPTGDHVPTCGIDHDIDVAGDIEAEQAGARRQDSGDGLAVDQDVGERSARGGDDRAVLDERLHCCSPFDYGFAILVYESGRRSR